VRRLIIFDCDGVLVDSEPLANRIFTEALNEIGLAIDYEEVCDAFVGLTMTRCIEQIEQRLGRAVPADFVSRLQERTFGAFRRELRPVRGIEQALSAIAEERCVASSGEIEKMRLTLGLTGLLPQFEGRLFSADQVERGKPHPDLFLFAAEQSGFAAESCLVVEDSVPGVQAAVAAKMPVLGYAERTDATRLRTAGARIFHSMEELPRLLNSR